MAGQGIVVESGWVRYQTRAGSTVNVNPIPPWEATNAVSLYASSVYVAELRVRLKTAAGGNRFIQVFDAVSVALASAIESFNPIVVSPAVAPGGEFVWQPPVEARQGSQDRREDGDYGHPFNDGIVVVASASEDRVDVGGLANEVRIMMRGRLPSWCKRYGTNATVSRT